MADIPDINNQRANSIWNGTTNGFNALEKTGQAYQKGQLLALLQEIIADQETDGKEKIRRLYEVADRLFNCRTIFTNEGTLEVAAQMVEEALTLYWQDAQTYGSKVYQQLEALQTNLRQ